MKAYLSPEQINGLVSEIVRLIKLETNNSQMPVLNYDNVIENIQQNIRDIFEHGLDIV